MEPAEKPAILNTLAKGISSRQIPSEKLSLYNLMDDESLDKITSDTGQRLWGAFITFGSASAGVLIIFMALQLIKYIADTLLHRYALHNIYGWNLHLIGGLWGSLIHLLLHLDTKHPESEE